MKPLTYLSLFCSFLVLEAFVISPIVGRWTKAGFLSDTRVDALVSEEVDTEKIISMSPRALEHLAKLKESKGSDIVLRMGVKSGGCSGMSYVMDLVSIDEVTGDDLVEDFPEHGFKCAIDPKSMLYLYGLRLDYSDALIGGGFQFINPNAESSCGCGKSFGV